MKARYDRFWVKPGSAEPEREPEGFQDFGDMGAALPTFLKPFSAVSLGGWALGLAVEGQCVVMTCAWT